MKQSNLSIYNPIPESFLSKKKKFNFKKNSKFQKNSDNSIIFEKIEKNCKKKNSLEELTKKFIKCIKSLKEDIIDLNDVVKVLNIKKRRIYDITNVLEGKKIIF